jgi:phenylpropionate dioxygenase-like ring-hydroxylating dioxygenase large terminal subunit
MLTARNNELITRTGPGTPMGEYLRRFWIPALISRELPQPDCPPLRLTLLGERLVAFRASSGSVGLIRENCPHRGASLFFGRNEEDGLRCVYHGWKFAVSGACVDMPSEPAESNFRTKVRATTYPALERGGMVWAYLGPPDLEPELPDYEWTLVPEDRVLASRRIQHCNYLQAIEGGIDSAHVPFLHGVLDPRERQAPSRKYLYGDLAPRLSVEGTDYGFAYGAQRDAEPDSSYWRFTPFMLPFFTVIPGFAPAGEPQEPESLTYSGHGWVPLDDESCWMFTYSWNASRPLREGEGHPAHFVELRPGSLTPLASTANDYFMDRGVQRSETYTGIENGSMQDAAIQESMGIIFDRTLEHVGTTDRAIIFLRNLYLAAVRDQMEGAEPALPRNPGAFRVRSVSAVLDRGVPFEEGRKKMERG